jgi:hypothetical protein
MNHSIIYGLLIGILLGILFKKLNIKYKGASSNKMKKFVYKYNNKCYKFDTEITICTSKIMF